MAANGSRALCGGALVHRVSISVERRPGASEGLRGSSVRLVPGVWALEQEGEEPPAAVIAFERLGSSFHVEHPWRRLPTGPTRCPCSVVGLWGSCPRLVRGRIVHRASASLPGRRLWAVSGYSLRGSRRAWPSLAALARGLSEEVGHRCESQRGACILGLAIWMVSVQPPSGNRFLSARGSLSPVRVMFHVERPVLVVPALYAAFSRGP